MPRIGLCVALVVAAVLTGPTATAGAPAGKAEPYATVTLITGDKVRLTRAQNGRVNVVPQAAKGREHIVFGVRQHGKAIEVYPSDAVPLVAQGRVDKRLFDVAALVKDGYGDMPTLPVIVQGGTAKGRQLTSINAQARRADKDLWRTVTSQPTVKVWLDGRVRASLDKSTAQVHAPQAWKRGFTGKGVRVAVLDTGVDETHPDLKGAVVARRDFSGSGSPADRNGHGTHVASIITGSGAKYKGVAPDVQLANGKVLGDDGVGYESGIIAGMEWAARDVKARVINVSIGGNPSDGTDPMSQAVNRLTASTGALFVVAAGNTYDRYSINAPGAADAALTVGAANRDRTTADFSSKGPRMNDYAQKPDLAAPGVAIAAARATGTDIGDNLNAFYTRLSGTSMATPHVAGAAAILAQRSPKWKASQLKTALVSTADAPNGRSWEQGAGFLNVERAITAKAWSIDDNVTLFAKWPHTRAITRNVRYVNNTSKPIELALSLHVANDSGAPVAAGVFEPMPKSVTIKAHSTATVQLAVDPRKSKPNTFYGGQLTATGEGGTTIRTALAAFVEFEAYDVTLDYVDRTGHRLTNFGQFAQVPVVLDPLTGRYWYPRFVGGRLVARLPRGTTYSVTENILTPGHIRRAPTVTTVSRPTFQATKPLTITLDARQAKRVEVRLDKTYKQRDAWAMEVMEAIPGDQWRTAAMGTATSPVPYVLGSAKVSGRAHQFTFFQAARAGGTTYETVVATGGQLPTTPTYRVRDRELAHVTYDLGCGGVAYPDGELFSGVAFQANGMFFGFDYGRDVSMPSVRKHLLTTNVQAGKTKWFSMLFGLDKEDVPIFSEGGEFATYEPGQNVRLEYLHPAYVPHAEGSYFPSGFMIANVNPVSSSRSVVGVDFASVTGSLTLRRDGVRIASAKELILNVEGLKGTGTYVLSAEAAQTLPWMAYAKRVRADWTFKATQPTNEDGVRLPMLTPRISGPFDAWGYAQAGTRVPLEFRVGGEGIGTVGKPEVWISYDEGATWRTLEVQPTAVGWQVAPTLPATAGYAALRVKATDDRGGAVDLTSYRSFGIR